jgi:hypothetical protein
LREGGKIIEGQNHFQFHIYWVWKNDFALNDFAKSPIPDYSVGTNLEK